MKIKLQSLSASSRWLQCTKSLEHNKTFTASKITVAGNFMHTIAELTLNGIFNDIDNSEKIKELKSKPYIDENAPDIKVNWNSWYQKTVDKYVNFAINLYNKYKPHKVLLEQKVDVKWYNFSKYGYIDLIMFCEKGVIICDLKTGSTSVEAEDNSQMLMYMLGVVQKFDKELPKTNYLGKMIIYQPNDRNAKYNAKVQDVYRTDLKEFYNSKAVKMEEIISGNLQFDPSTTACKWCDYRLNCKERIKKGVV